MNAGAKLAAYGLVLVAMVGGGAAVGSAVGPIDLGDDAGHDAGHAADAEGAGSSALPAGGLLVSQDGYTLDLDDRTLATGRPRKVAFVIAGPDGGPLRDYEELHDRELHFIVVSNDLIQYEHLLPSRDAGGMWSVELPALPAGGYRAYVDFQPVGGQQLTLGIDLTAPGQVAAPARLTERRIAEVEGYEVTLTGRPVPGGQSEVTITVRRDGKVVTTEPYLGAAGHLVAIRDGDLAYLHVHPLDDEPTGPVRFAVEAPSASTYGLYFDFAHAGAVRTAAFTIDIDGPSTDAHAIGPSPTTAEDAGHGGH